MAQKNGVQLAFVTQILNHPHTQENTAISITPIFLFFRVTTLLPPASVGVFFFWEITRMFRWAIYPSIMFYTATNLAHTRTSNLKSTSRRGCQWKLLSPNKRQAPFRIGKFLFPARVTLGLTLRYSVTPDNGAYVN